MLCCLFFFFFFKQKTAYEMRISDWSSDVCSSDLSDAALSELGDELAQRVLPRALGQGDGLVLRHRRGGADEVGLLARDEHDARAVAQDPQRSLEDAHLGVAGERERVVLPPPGLHAPGGVEEARKSGGEGKSVSVH